MSSSTTTSALPVDNVMKAIIKEIVRHCYSVTGESPPESLAAFMVKAVVVDPANDFHIHRDFSPEDVERLILLCVDRLLNDSGPGLETAKMQVFFDTNYSNQAELLEQHVRNLGMRLQPILREITDNCARNSSELEALYRKIVSYLLLRSEIGVPTDITVVRETTAALESVFPQTELGTFMSLLKREKEIHLKDLSMIVAGIRLFNQHCGKGGEGIEDLPSILCNEVGVVSGRISSRLCSICAYAVLYTDRIEKLTPDIDDQRAIKPDVLSQLEFIKAGLINAQQFSLYLSILQSDVTHSRQKLASLEERYKERMISLKNLVKSKTAVPTDQVYPQFIAVASLWMGFQDELYLLSIRSGLLASLETFASIHSTQFTDQEVETMIQQLAQQEAAGGGGGSLATEEENTGGDDTGSGLISVSGRIERNVAGLDVLYADTTPNFSQLPLEYHGFCPVTLTSGTSMLVKGNTALGVVSYKDRLYAFASKRAAYDFASSPQRYLNEVLEMGKRRPELIQLMDLQSQLSALVPYDMVRSHGKMGVRPVTKCDSICQTDTHIVEAKIEKNYEWNEWELRRKALKLVNLRGKATHSVQTDLSHFRRDNDTQIYPLRSQYSHAKSDGSSKVPKRQNFVRGLRGISDAKQVKVVDLTLPIIHQ